MTDSSQNSTQLSERQRAIEAARLAKKKHGQLEDQELRRLAVEITAGIFQSSFYRGLPALSISSSRKLANILIARTASDANLARIDELLEQLPADHGVPRANAGQGEPSSEIEQDEAELLATAKAFVDKIEAERRHRDAEVERELIKSAELAVGQVK